MSLKNWKAGAAARVQAAKERGTKAIYPKTQVDVGKGLTAKLTDKMMAMCEKYGIKDHNGRVRCSAAIMQETSRHFRTIQTEQKASDSVLLKFCDGLKGVLGEYGVADQGTQEQFILEYLAAIEEVS